MNSAQQSNLSNTQKVVARFAPSPTGTLHAGNYRTAVFSYLYAKKYSGEFILRIEDTDKARSTKEYEENIMESLSWLDLPFDTIYRQSENVERHKEVLVKLIAEGKAYISKEEVREEGQRAEVIRFKNPNKVVTFFDVVRGNISFDTTELKDFVIARSLEEPLFHLAVVVDDFDEGITHVIRGEDHISNTPRQILIGEAIGAPIPIYAHLPLVLAPDRTKLSKRKGARPMTDYKKDGYEPEALINYMALIGWNPGTEQEFFTKDELISEFNLARVQKSSANFDEVKLLSINRHYLLKKYLEKPEELMERLWSFASADITKHSNFESRKEVVTKNVMERLSYIGEIKKMEETGELAFYFEQPSYMAELLLCSEKMRKGVNITLQTVKEYLVGIQKEIEGMDDKLFTNAESVKATLMPFADSLHRGGVLWATRIALSGKEKSPDPFTLISLFGKEESVKRLQHAQNLL